MPTECPACGKDINDRLHAEEIRDFDTDHEIECPECGAKLLASMTWDFHVECVQGTFVCPKCGRDKFEEKFFFDIHQERCKGKLVLSNNNPVEAQEEGKE
jgi:DNA-directed RNA polymerase subunit RPC12/RpoP